MHGLGRCGELMISTRETFRSFRFYFAGRTYTRPHLRDSYDYTYLLERCKSKQTTKMLHAQIIIGGYEQNPFVAAKLVGKYVEYSYSSMEVARKVFDSLLDRDVFVWNMLIQGYANLGPFVEALDLYYKMRLSGLSANRYTYPFLLKACGAMKDGKKGQVVHGHVVKFGLDSDLFVSNALIAFYAKCKDIEISRKVFDKLHAKDTISWNSLISGYTANGFVDEALMLFHSMLRDHSTGLPDHATLVCTLPACVEASAIQVGFWIHSYIVKSGMKVDSALGSGLISMYANCGRVSIARDVFVQIKDKNVVAWSAMIRCYGMHGYADEALQMFSQFLDFGLHPDGVIFLCLLSACSHAGMVAKGWEIFEEMEDYGVEKNESHYACMVDLLGRAGFIGQAVEFIESMPAQPGKDVYGALLGACRIHNNIELAEEAANKLLILDPDNAGRYVILAKMYEDAGRWEDAARVRTVVREKKIKKLTGCSSIEVNSIHHTFGVDDESHPLTEQIFSTLERLDRNIQEVLVV
ncbi:hypothetical protein FNV43_RR18644 [Rhamnella rubrinervis]|uniref:Pentatricopeptide repeat-containing protein n=1 Tax=Rhamnella rubrinervis TaxID=2594499 RepID=A0A8K0DZR6_9ROSA|nr:hypothetical protein FNV43_RR18644 [Rhamnella rubrinervis]